LTGVHRGKKENRWKAGNSQRWDKKYERNKKTTRGGKENKQSLGRRNHHQ